MVVRNKPIILFVIFLKQTVVIRGTLVEGCIGLPVSKTRQSYEESKQVPEGDLMKFHAMKTNHMVKPIGFTMDSLVLSWKVESLTASFQKAARVEIARDKTFSDPLHDSGRREDIDSIAYSPFPRLELQPETRYFWRVTVWADDGTVTVSDPEWFEMGKMNTPFSGKWITGQSEEPFLLRKAFRLDPSRNIASARLYATAAGVYEVEINGSKAGVEYLAPFCNKYSAWMQVQTYDVTELLHEGDNAIGVLTGDGWYKGRFGFDGGTANLFGDQVGFLCDLIVTFDDGSRQIIATDESWKSAPSFITFSSIYDGEWQDARQGISGWSSPACEGEWFGTKALDIDKSLLKDRLSIPVITKETIVPVTVLTTPAGETVLDMGQNMVGWLEFNVDLPEGAELHLQFGEILQHDNFYNENLRHAKQAFRYVSDGKVRRIRPHFTYYGFRYVKVEGWSGVPQTADFAGCVIYSDMERTGWLETSNKKVNQLIENAMWGQKGNFLDVPTDCPQRDERMGWTGDAQVFCATATFNMDTFAFYRKYLYDMQREQELHGGTVPVVVPNLIRNEGFVMTSSAWADATTIIPWTSYLFSGDRSILEQHYPSMKAYVETLLAQDDGSRLWTPEFSFGDWLAQDAATPYTPIGGTDINLISTAYYYYSTLLTARAAAVLGNQTDAETYFRLADEIRAAYREEFITQRGRLAVDTQTGAVVSLFMELLDGADRERVAARLQALLKQNNFYLKTGFVGTPYLCRVLSAAGYNDTAYKLLLNEGFPSWLYCVNLGATTIWERWNSVQEDGLIGDTGMNSLNHYAYGSVCEWMYRDICGINPIPAHPGFRRVRLEPKPNGRLNHAKARHDSPVGLYESGWELAQDGTLTITVKVPFGGTAELVLPDSGKEVQVLTQGTHVFSYKPEKEYRFLWSTSTATVGEMLSNPKVVDIVHSVHPGALDFFKSVMGMNQHATTLRDILGKFGFKCTAEELDVIDEALTTVPCGMD